MLCVRRVDYENPRRSFPDNHWRRISAARLAIDMAFQNPGYDMIFVTVTPETRMALYVKQEFGSHFPDSFAFLFMHNVDLDWHLAGNPDISAVEGRDRGADVLITLHHKKNMLKPGYVNTGVNNRDPYVEKYGFAPISVEFSSKPHQEFRLKRGPTVFAFSPMGPRGELLNPHPIFSKTSLHEEVFAQEYWVEAIMNDAVTPLEEEACRLRVMVEEV